MNLTPGFTVVDYQSTPSGYYQVSFRHPDGSTIIVTQEGRGGCNHYTSPNRPLKDELMVWLGANDGIAIEQMDMMGFHELSVGVQQREIEWEDTVVMAIANAIEVGVLSVEG